MKACHTLINEETGDRIYIIGGIATFLILRSIFMGVDSLPGVDKLTVSLLMMEQYTSSTKLKS